MTSTASAVVDNKESVPDILTEDAIKLSESPDIQLSDIGNGLLFLPNISDLFLTSGERIWLNNNGKTLPYGNRIIKTQEIALIMSELMPEISDINDAIAAKEAERDISDKRTGLDFGAEFGGIRVRGNISKSNLGNHSLVLRKLNSKIPRYAETTLPANVLQQTSAPTGLILVTGATGSGKSTSLASIVNEINIMGGKHIITIEDPNEYEFKSINCLITTKCIGKDGPSFSAVLRAAMRQAPNVIMIGEIRDSETMRIALEASETGHIVLATLHTNSCSKTVDRVTSFFSQEEKEWAQTILASNLRAIVSQTLIPRKTGSGRALAYEVMINTPDVANNIKTGQVSAINNALNQGSASGQVLMNRHLLTLIQKDVISIEAAFKKAYDADGLKALLLGNGIQVPKNVGMS